MITLKSHGFKYGRPEANYYFDVSFFKNPWRDEVIRLCQSEVKKELAMDFMLKQEGVFEFVNSVSTVLQTLNKLFPEESIIVAFCCSAGEYRSPVIAALVAKELAKRDVVTYLEKSKQSKI